MEARKGITDDRLMRMPKLGKKAEGGRGGLSSEYGKETWMTISTQATNPSAETLQARKIANQQSITSRDKKRKTRPKPIERIQDEADEMEKMISETSGLSLESANSVEGRVAKIDKKNYFVPGLKSAYQHPNDARSKLTVDQFSKFLKHLFKNDFKQDVEFLRMNRFYCPVRRKKKCLVLDLDETLVFAHNEYSDTNYDEAIDLYIGEGKKHRILVYYRPFLREFLDYVSPKWEIGIFTSSSSIYANAILQRIDPDNKYFDFRLYKSACYRDCNNHLVKDLDLLGNRELKDTVLVDNSIDAVIYQLDNCVPVQSFYGDQEDRQLVDLAKYLDLLYEEDDVRVLNQKYFQLKRFLDFDSLQAIEKFIIEEL